MSLICNVHTSSQFLDVLPPLPLQQQQLGLSAAQQQLLQMQREAAAGGDEELLQVPIRLGSGPVVAGSEAPGESLRNVVEMCGRESWWSGSREVMRSCCRFLSGWRVGLWLLAVRRQVSLWSGGALSIVVRECLNSVERELLGDEELLQVPIRLGSGPVVAGSEAPGEPLRNVVRGCIEYCGQGVLE
jgi:hypothetical protein